MLFNVFSNKFRSLFNVLMFKHLNVLKCSNVLCFNAFYIFAGISSIFRPCRIFQMQTNYVSFQSPHIFFILFAMQNRV